MLSSYHFFLLVILAVVAYAISAILVSRGRIAMLIHRRLWNYLLLGSFLASGFLGLWLAFFIDYKLSIGWYREFLWLHVEFGIIMAVISFFHIAWHWRYFVKKK